MIRKIKSIGNLGVFKGFEWDAEVHGEGGKAITFHDINIIYGRNYSGKTTLSRIIRSLETGMLSDKFENPSFSVTLDDNSHVTQAVLKNHTKTIRVFNEDFIRDNLRFITNPDENIESFAILGDDNNKIEQEIAMLELELGSSEKDNETGLYAQLSSARVTSEKASQMHQSANAALESQLSSKATDKKIGIKYKSERFGDQNYTIQKLKGDISLVQAEDYHPPSEEQLTQYEKLILETALQPIPPLQDT